MQGVNSRDLNCHYFHLIFSILCHANLINEWYEWLGTEKGKKITIIVKSFFQYYNGYYLLLKSTSVPPLERTNQ